MAAAAMCSPFAQDNAVRQRQAAPARASWPASHPAPPRPAPRRVQFAIPRLLGFDEVFAGPPVFKADEAGGDQPATGPF